MEVPVVNLDDPNATKNGWLGTRKSAQIQITTKLTDISKYFVKDILNILDSSDKKGKTKLKEIRNKMYEYLKTLD